MAHQPFLQNIGPLSARDDSSIIDQIESLDFGDSINPRHTPKHHRLCRWKSLSFPLFFLLTLSNLFFFHQWRTAASDACIRPKLSYSPAKSAIRYEKKTLRRNIDNNIYTGEPREELDNAWHDLLLPMVIKITAHEMREINETSISLVDGGYIAEMAAFHELHCIKRIRRHLHLDHYYPNMTDDELDRETRHMDHCLEYWREAAMCRGDSSLATFVWFEDKPFSKRSSDHECINWDSFAGWAKERMVDVTDYSILTKEVSGPI